MSGFSEKPRLHEETKMTKTTETVQSEQIDDTKLMQAGFAQCAFVGLQSAIFPELGVLGAIVAAQCALMPWLVPVAKKAPAMAAAMAITSAALTPVFSVVCLYAADIIKGLSGA